MIYPFFKQPLYFTNPSLNMGKIWTSSLCKKFENSTPYQRGSSNYDIAFYLKKYFLGNFLDKQIISNCWWIVAFYTKIDDIDYFLTNLDSKQVLAVQELKRKCLLFRIWCYSTQYLIYVNNYFFQCKHQCEKRETICKNCWNFWQITWCK